MVEVNASGRDGLGPEAVRDIDPRAYFACVRESRQKGQSERSPPGTFRANHLRQ
jgi:hypothetical protein